MRAIRFNPRDLNDGIFWWEKEEGALAHQIYALKEDQQGRIWMASEEGLYRYDLQSGEGAFSKFTTAEGLLDDHVTTIMEDSEGRIWLGTMGGLNLFDEQNEEDRFIDYTTKNGLGNDVIWSIVEDRKKNIWVSTEQGITLLVPQEETDPSGKLSFRPYLFDKGDGLKRLDFNGNSVCLDRQNRLWWGCEGATMLNLSHFELATEVPANLHLTHIEVNQEFVDFRNLTDKGDDQPSELRDRLSRSFEEISAFYNYPLQLDLPHDLDHLTFHFSAFEWDRPHRLEYQYFLEGLEDDWGVATSETRVDYRSLSSGRYVFKVRARGDAGAWSEPLEYRFNIRPAPWFSIWAIIGYGGIFLGFAGWFIRFKKRKWELRNELKKEQEKTIRVSRRESFRSRLYTNLTHEFRTPLNVIIGMTEQIQDDPEQHLEEGVSMIQRNSKQLLRLINQLLDLAKLEDQSLQLQLKRGDIVPYLRYHTDSFKTYAGRKGLILQFKSEVAQIIMDYDPEQVGHIMTNLISNAIKFTPMDGKVRVKIDRLADSLLIEVSDTGIGIPPEHHSQVFQRFYQVDASTTRKGEGSGIGLAHTYELVKLMGGDIDVKSTVDEGTIFRVLLPVRISDKVLAPAEERPGEIDTDASNLLIQISGTEAEKLQQDLRAGKTRQELPRVLIVEDNRDTMTYLISCLTEKYVIDVAQNGQVGIEKAQASIPDMIISDVMMPEKSGFDLCRVLKNDERTSHIPIILLTAKADLDSKIEGLSTGADAYLYKPFEKKELLVRLETMVEKQKKLLAHFSKRFAQGIVEPAPVPDIDKEISPVDKEFIERIRKIVAENFHDEHFGLTDLCEKANMSRSQLFRKMKALIGTPPSDFIRKYRLEKAKKLLETTHLTAREVAFRTGYKDPGHFSKSFREEYHMHPSEAGKRSK